MNEAELSRLYDGFEEATPLAFGEGDAASCRDWRIDVPDGIATEELTAAWALLTARHADQRMVTIGWRENEGHGVRALRLDVDEDQTTAGFIETVAEQLKLQTASEAEVRAVLQLDDAQALFFSVVDGDSGIYGSAEVSEQTLDAVTERLNRLLHGLRLDKTVRNLSLMSDAETVRVLQKWNPAPTPYPEKPVQSLFEVQAAAHPENTALIFEGGTLSYADLNRQANRLAHLLMQEGVVPGQSVATYLERGPAQIITTLAALKAGAAYLPLDTEFPIERVEQMLEDAVPAVLLIQKRNPPKVSDRTKVLSLDALDEALDAMSCENPETAGSIDDRAYIMYTSGSTGRPKGVEVPHRGIVRLLFGADYVPLGPETVVLHMAAVSFDASTFEIWAPLLHGGICALSPSRVPTLESIGRLINAYGVNTLWMTASLFNLAVAEAPEILRPVRWLLTGGEALSPWHVGCALEQLLDTQLINGYGPTENTTFSTTHAFDRDAFDAARPIPIGQPISNSTCYILDRFLRPVPPGVPGELYVGGDGVATGYLGNPNLTAERFLFDPFRGMEGARMYKTGDRVYWMPDGQIGFIGRVDDQIKLRGFRIELPEIDAVLAAFPGVQQAVTIVHEDQGRGKWLAGYVKVEDPDRFNVQALERHAADKLPDYMVPSAFVPVQKWTYTPSGKLDRSALPKPDLSGGGQSYAPPETPTHEALCAIWQQLLGQERVGIDDSFFDLGGDSLRGVHLFHKIHEHFGGELPLSALMRHPTIRGLAYLIDGEAPDADRMTAYRCLQEIQPGHPDVPPLFMIHGGAGNVIVFRELARHLGPEQPVYAFQWSGWDGRRGERSISRMAAMYKEELLRFSPRPRYRLGGHCIGGLIALELAHLLAGEGIGIDGPLIVSDCPNLQAASYRLHEPETRPERRKAFEMMTAGLAEACETDAGPEVFTPRLDPSLGARAALKHWPRLVRTVHRLRSSRVLLKYRLRLLFGGQVPIEERASYSFRTLIGAARRHRPQPTGKKVLYFRSSCVLGRELGLQGWWESPFMGFEELCPADFEGHVLSGGHNEVLDHPAAAEKIRQCWSRP